MRVLSGFLLVLFGISVAILCAAQLSAQQAPTQSLAAPWTLLMDPVCPVAPYPGRPNGTKELRVLYFPTGNGAKLKDSKSLSLQVGFNGPNYVSNRALVPFSRKGDHWEALAPLEKSSAAYAIFSVKDDDTNAVDDNSGKYWDVVSCTPLGDKDSNGLMLQAESYCRRGVAVRNPKRKRPEQGGVTAGERDRQQQISEIDGADKAVGVQGQTRW